MVLNWNGAANLRQFLPGVLTAAEMANADVWVIDNNSDDDSARVCSREFPSVRFEQLPENRSLASYNIAAPRCEADVFVSLDNDVLVEPNFLPPLLDHFDRNEDVFAVSSWIKGYPPDSADDPGVATNVEWRQGMLRGRSRQPTERSMPVFYNCGCATAFDRRKFLMLGGFDRLFFPLYYEDTDLSWRAWKHGWSCLYEPKSIVYHKGGGALGRSQAVTTLVLRNEFLFHWKNVSDPRLVASHVASTIPRLLVAAARRDKARLRGFARALPYLPEALRTRRLSREDRRLTDREAIERVNARAKASAIPARGSIKKVSHDR
jgi:GT2 family glycosyltransferase